MREYRMYGLVPYNISPIQQGIQFGHAVVEYGIENASDPTYLEWAKNHKTFIILNGGTSNENPKRLGSMQKHMAEMLANGVKISTFHEPDLNDMLTAVVFIVDDRVFDTKTWPSYETVCKDYMENGAMDHAPSYDAWLDQFAKDPAEVGRILFLRSFIKQFRLA